MKHLLLYISLLTFVIAKPDCNTMPAGMELAKSMEAKNISKAKELLKVYKEDVKKYLSACDKSKDTFEITSIMIHTYEDRLKDIEYDMNQAIHTTDCSKIPSSASLNKAFKSKDIANIKGSYTKYKNDSETYLENCASHAEYATVYDESLFYEEEYANWQ